MYQEMNAEKEIFKEKETFQIIQTDLKRNFKIWKM